VKFTDDIRRQIRGRLALARSEQDRTDGSSASDLESVWWKHYAEDVELLLQENERLRAAARPVPERLGAEEGGCVQAK
jgi:hypothetical protein